MMKCIIDRQLAGDYLEPDEYAGTIIDGKLEWYITILTIEALRNLLIKFPDPVSISFHAGGIYIKEIYHEDHGYGYPNPKPY